MSHTEDDSRAAQTARAKAMLRRKQQQKTSSRGPSLSSHSLSRSSTPVLAEPVPSVEQDKRARDINDVFNSSSDAGADWVQSLPRAEVPEVTNIIAKPRPQSWRPSPPPPQERTGTPVTTPLGWANQQVLDYLEGRAPPLKDENSTLQSSLTHFNETQADAREKDRTGTPVTTPLGRANQQVLDYLEGRAPPLKDENSTLQSSLMHFNETQADAREKDKESFREKSGLEDLYGGAQTKSGKLETGRLELEQRLDEASRKVDSLQSDIRRLTSELGSAQREVLTARDHSSRVGSQLSIARSQIEELHTSAARDSERWQEQDQSRQQTISLLVSEKASLIGSVQRLEEVEIELQEKETLFLAEQAKATKLANSVQGFEITTLKQGNDLEETLARERELLERVREHEREIQLRKAELEEVQAASTQHQQRVRELEEQIESDDRADKLEVSLKNTQDRADELEFQFNKVQQTHTTIKGERDNLESQLRLKTQSEAEWKARHCSLETEHSVLQNHLQTANNRRDVLLEERASLQSQVEFNQSTIKQLQQKLGELASELTSSDRALHNVQGELRAALRRAEESEKTQKDLQAEGTGLMQSLEDMRPKIVELTSIKLELMEQIERLEHEKRSRDTLISKLEMALNEGTEREAEAAKLRKESDALRERDNQSLQQSVAELQRGYSLVEAELETAQATTKTLETERARMLHTEVRQADLSNRMGAEARRREEEISQLESALASSRKNEAEQSQLIHHYRTELESVQSELMAKEEELESVRSSDGGDDHRHDQQDHHQSHRSLDDEMLGAVKQQHAMELSSAHSQIRALESTVFDAQDRAHRLQRQVHILENQLASRSLSRASQRPFSPGSTSTGIGNNARPASRTSNELRRGSLAAAAAAAATAKSSSLVPPTRSVFDVGLSPETRHKRQVSLSMLKARIESETAAQRHTPTPPPRGLSPVLDSLSETDSHSHRPQFMDESHIFWCHSCRGELVIL